MTHSPPPAARNMARPHAMPVMMVVAMANRTLAATTKKITAAARNTTAGKQSSHQR
ncbi:hypothetical protein AB1285_22500 [Microbacterium sp. NRRL B-14842]|uniref:hypothetical protein n=1 Tax=Microbacterium sp. NRRL B-14842 TaxID=3162881 RepID=UPI003D2C0579